VRGTEKVQGSVAVPKDRHMPLILEGPWDDWEEGPDSSTTGKQAEHKNAGDIGSRYFSTTKDAEAAMREMH